MLTTEEKLRHFSRSVFARAQKQADDTLEKARQEVKRQKDVFESKCLEQAYQTIQQKTRKTRRQMQETVAQQKLEARRALFKSREAMVDDIFAQAAARLAAFRTEDGYIQFLKDAIRQAQTALGTEHLQIFLDAADKPLLDALQAAYPSAVFTLETSEGSRLGGIRALDEAAGRTADFSVTALLRTEREHFLAESGFTL